MIINNDEFFDIVKEVSPNLLENFNGENELEVYVYLSDILDNLDYITGVLKDSSRSDLFYRLLRTHEKRSIDLDKIHTIEELQLFVTDDSSVIGLDLFTDNSKEFISNSKEKMDELVKLIITLDLLGIDIYF